MKNFLYKILSSKSEISSSRFYAGITLIAFILLSLLSLFPNITPDIEIYKGLVAIFGLCVGGATVSKFNGESNTQEELRK